MKPKQRDPELERLIAAAQRSLDRPWEFLERTLPAALKTKKRAEVVAKTIGASNQQKRHNAAIKYAAIRNFARQVIDADSKLRRASPNRLAIKIHKLKPGWSVRTIRRALTPPSK
jgi:hypothetical protein